MIPDENYSNSNFRNKPIEDIKFVPFKDALNLESPVMIDKNEKNNNVYTFNSNDKEGNELYSYNKTDTSRSPSEMIKDMNTKIDDTIDYDAKDSSIDNIFKEINSKSPGTITLMEAYNIPFPIAKLIGRRFIKLTLDINKRSR